MLKPIQLICALAWLSLVCFSSCNKEQYFAFGKYQLVALPIDTDITDMTFLDSLRGYACGGRVWDKGFVITTRDGGLTWTKEYTSDARLEAIAAHSATGQVWSCGQAGIVVHKPTDTTALVTQRQDYNSWNLGISISDSKQVCYVNGEGFRFGKVRTINQPTNSVDTIYDGPNELADITHLNDSIVMAVGYGYVLRSTDTGRTWQRLDLVGAFFKAVAFHGLDGVIVAEDGRTWLSNDSGATWRKGSDLHAPLTDIAWATDQEAYTCASDGAVFKSTDAGTSWSKANDLPAGAWLSVHCIGASVWLAGKNGVCLRAER